MIVIMIINKHDNNISFVKAELEHHDYYNNDNNEKRISMAMAMSVIIMTIVMVRIITIVKMATTKSTMIRIRDKYHQNESKNEMYGTHTKQKEQ